MNLCKLAMAAVIATAARGTVGAEDQLVVVTAYHTNVSEPFRAAFVAAHPGIEVKMLWRESRAALDAIENREEGGADVYWGASPGNFRALAGNKLLAELGAERGDLPERIGEFPLIAADRSSTAFELAGYGFIINRKLSNQNRLEQPRDWLDLERPEYAGQLLLPVPSQQGTARLPYEILLQAHGWEEGWRHIARMAANGQLLPPDVSSLSDAVAAGTKPIGISIDFYARGTMEGDDNIAFVYPKTAAYSAAEVGILADAPHPDNAREFVRFLLSVEGQRMLTMKSIERLPIHPEVYRTATTPASYNPYALDRFRPVAYSQDLAGQRGEVLSALFDATITEQHALLVATMQALRDAEQAAGSDQNARLELERARQSIGVPPIEEAAANSPELRRRFPLGGMDKWDTAARQQYAAWRDQAAAQLRQAAAVASAVRKRFAR